MRMKNAMRNVNKQSSQCDDGEKLGDDNTPG